jgi:outer membrane protein TolC
MLARWIGDEAQSVSLAAAPAFEILPSTRETLLATLHQHASLLAYEAQIALAQSEVNMARAEKHADWSAELAYARRGDAFSDMVSLEFRVGLPLFSRHRQDPLISAKRAEVTQLEAQREAELRMHSEEVISTLAAWQSARDRVDLYQRERLPLARQRSKVALASYQAGGIPLADVLASIVAEVQIRQNHAELLRELGRSWVLLRYLELPEGLP